MNIIEKIKNRIEQEIKNHFNLTELPFFTFELNVDAENTFGDISSNIAMITSKIVKKAPRDIASLIANLQIENVEKIEIAGPGFINITLTKKGFDVLLLELKEKGRNFFKENTNPKFKYNIEFVSANPTGPIHLGNGRGGIIGDVLASVLNFVGNTAKKEYYINDAGNQIQKLGMSFKIRCLQALGENITLPEEAYHGEYLVEMAETLVAQEGDKLRNLDESFFANYAKDKILDYLKNTLASYGIYYDTWFSEKSLHDSGQILKSLEDLDSKGYIYKKDDAVWFKSTDFGDDKDRVVIKSDGTLTYAAADIAYMQSKIERGSDYMIMILGHDHHSFAQRLYGLHKALGLEKYPLDVILYQLVKMKAGDEQVRMSKRAGNIVTLKDVIDTVGKDVARFFYLNKKADSQLEFDLDLALKQTDENPVFYIQYALVRAKNILKKAAESNFSPSYENLDKLSSNENNLLKKIVCLKDILSSIETTHQTYLLANYTIELAAIFHKYYTQVRILGMDDKSEIEAKLSVVQEYINCLDVCLELMGISRPDKM